MRKFLHIIIAVILLGLVAVALFSCSNNNPTPPVVIKEKVDSTKLPKLKMVFIVVGKGIDYNNMAVKEITDVIQKDSILEVRGVSPEVFIKPQIIKVYRVEDITCPYLKKRFKENKPGELVYEYNDKILIKLSDGVIKVYHSHVYEIK